MKTYRVKKEGEYPWACKNKQNRMIRLFKDDQLTKNEDGKHTKHTGICCVGIELDDKEVEVWENPPRLTIV